jgi:prepilin-type processing-associated H-X9-DG protein
MKLELKGQRPGTLQETTLYAMKASAAFSLLDLLIALVCLVVASTFILPQIARPRGCSARMNCVNNLKQIGLSFRCWALDNNDQYPMRTSVTNEGCMEMPLSRMLYRSFAAISNELSTPKLLVCPEDSSRSMADSFDALTARNVSYFLGMDASDTNANMFLAGDDNILIHDLAAKPGLLNLTTNSRIALSQARHRSQGNIGLADGSVLQVSSGRLAEALRNTGSATNRLLIP